jgi:hypothetical protein
VSIFGEMAQRLEQAGTRGLAKIFEDFENGVGTYLKVVRFPEPTVRG